MLWHARLDIWAWVCIAYVTRIWSSYNVIEEVLFLLETSLHWWTQTNRVIRCQSFISLPKRAGDGWIEGEHWAEWGFSSSRPAALLLGAVFCSGCWSGVNALICDCCLVTMQEVTATSRHYVDRLFDPDPQKVLQGVMWVYVCALVLLRPGWLTIGVCDVHSVCEAAPCIRSHSCFTSVCIFLYCYRAQSFELYF